MCDIYIYSIRFDFIYSQLMTQNLHTAQAEMRLLIIIIFFV